MSDIGTGQQVNPVTQDATTTTTTTDTASAKTVVQNVAQARQQLTGEGARFVYAAATVANIICTNLTQTQVNLLGNFLSVITTCVFAILTVENPTEVLGE